MPKVSARLAVIPTDAGYLIKHQSDENFLLKGTANKIDMKIKCHSAPLRTVS